MKVAGGHVHHAAPKRVLDVGLPDLPFLRHHPVEDGRPRGNVVHDQREMASEDRESLTYALAGDAAEDRIQLADQLVQLASDAGSTHRARA